jgi:hypothetical protein
LPSSLPIPAQLFVRGLSLTAIAGCSTIDSTSATSFASAAIVTSQQADIAFAQVNALASESTPNLAKRPKPFAAGAMHCCLNDLPSTDSNGGTPRLLPDAPEAPIGANLVVSGENLQYLIRRKNSVVIPSGPKIGMKLYLMAG